MKSGFWVILAFLCSPLFLWSALPQTRVLDEHGDLSPSARMLLEDQLESMARDQKVEAYVIILANESTEAASKLGDQRQAEWVPKGLGGVFVFCMDTRRYCFTGTPETMEQLNDLQLRILFNRPIDNPLLAKSLDVEISAPVFRVLTALGVARINYRAGAIEAGEKEIVLWRILAGIAAIVAVAGWLVALVKFTTIAQKRSGRGNIPPEGMAYVNPPRRSRSKRRNQHSEESDRDAGKDRF